VIPSFPSDVITPVGESRSNAPLLTGVAFVLLSLSCVVGLQYDIIGQWNDRVVYAFVAVLSVTALGTLLVLSDRPWSSALAVYAVIFWIFHFGLVAVFGLGLVVEGDLTPAQSRWFLRADGRMAAVIALSGFLALLGAGLAASSRPARLASRSLPAPIAHQAGRLGDLLGALLVIGCILTWFTLIGTSFGLGTLVGSYMTYRDAEEQVGGIIAMLWFALGFGIVLLATAQTTMLTRAANSVFALFALIALPLGMRGEVLFPLAAGLVARGTAGRAPSRRVVLSAVAILLVLIPTLKQIRSVGLASIGARQEVSSPWEAFIELGGSLQPVQKMVAWRVEGDRPTHGSTYLAPLERLLPYFIPGTPRLTAAEDPRLMNSVMQSTVGEIGFSPIAESFWNFGAIGVVMAMGLVGIVTSSIDRLRGTAGRFATAVVMVPLLINVRNSFTPLPAQLLVGAFVTFSMLAIAVIAASLRGARD